MRGYLRFDLADNCNIRCIMCQAYNGTPVTNVKFTNFEDFVKGTKGQLSDWGTIQLGNVAEAMIHPRFDDFLRYIRDESGATIHVVTNGKLLSRHADAINAVGNCLIQVSMDSVNEKTHEYIRAGSKFDNVVSSLDQIDLTNNRVLLSFTLMNSNIEEYPDMIEFAKSRGFMVSAFPMMLRDEQGVIPFQLIKESLWFNKEGLANWLKLHYGASSEGNIIGSATGDEVSHVDSNCNAHELDLVIDAGGSALLCGKKTIGNIYISGLEEVWSSSQANSFRAEINRDQSPCMDCDYSKRCLRPSMSLLDNHFAEPIAHLLDDRVRESIKLTRNISDAVAMDIFINALCKTFKIFEISEIGDGFEARRVLVDHGFEQPIKAKKRHELQQLMVGEAGSPYAPKLTEQGFHGYNLIGYMGKFWAAPQSIGKLNIVMQSDRERPEILSAETIGGLKELIRVNSSTATAHMISGGPNIIEQGFHGYNLIGYMSKFWAAPQSIGHLDFTMQADRERPEILSAETIQGLKAMVMANLAGSVITIKQIR